jgi:hypothetical protein
MRAKKPYRTLVQAFGLSSAVLSRHRAHMPDNAPVPAQGKQLAAIDAQIVELRRIQARAKRNKNSAAAADIGLKVARELRSWFALRLQISRAVELTPSLRARSEPELSAEQLQTAAQILLRGKK